MKRMPVLFPFPAVSKAYKLILLVQMDTKKALRWKIKETLHSM